VTTLPGHRPDAFTSAIVSAATFQVRATTAAQRKKAKAKAEKLNRIRDRWHDPNYDTDDLIRESGLSRRTVYDALKARFPDDAGLEHA
jgi:hypothetical protein